jgi:transposase
VEDVTDEPLYRDRVCGIDIGKAGMAVTIRVPSDRDPARRASETRLFATTKQGVLALADWMRCWQVPAVVMEATSDYWKPVLYRLEAEGFECVLADARQVKNLPGRPKRDTTDSQWLACCFERGSVFPCFVATPEFRIIRLHTRRRRDLTGERTREKQRAEKLLEDAAIKLSSVLTDLHGVTGREIMDRLIAGERDPRALAECARTRARRKIPQLREALEGAEFFTAHHARLLQSILNRIDLITTETDELSQVIEELLAPYEEQLQQAASQPGWTTTNAGATTTATSASSSASSATSATKSPSAANPSRRKLPQPDSRPRPAPQPAASQPRLLPRAQLRIIFRLRDRRSTATPICDGAARSCFHTQASLSRSVIGSAGPPGGGSLPISYTWLC